MLRSTFMVVMLVVSAYLYAQDERVLGDFSEIHVATGIQVKLVEGHSSTAEVTVDGGESNEVITEISHDKILSIRFTGGTKLNRKASVTLFSDRKISKLRASTAASIYSSDPIEASHIVLEGETGGRIDVALDVDQLSLDLSSGSVVTLMGVARQLSSEVSSGAALYAFQLQTEKIHAECSSGGNMEIFAVTELKAKCSMGGKIVYAGQPELDKNESSSGTILPKRD